MQKRHIDEFHLRSGLTQEPFSPTPHPEDSRERKSHIDAFHLYADLSAPALNPVTPMRQDISIAYFLMVHRFPEQFQRLFNALYHPKNHYLIHVDQKAEPRVLEEVERFLVGFPNAYRLESENVVWGGYSMVQAELDGINYLLDSGRHWDFFINLSGQDFPLKTQTYIRRFLAANRHSSFLKFANQATERPDTMNRIAYCYTDDDVGFPVSSHTRRFLENVTPYIGGQWMMLTRDCCEFLCHSGEMKEFEDYYRHTLIADEAFFPTALMNSSFSGHLVNDDKRAILWVPDGDIKLRPKTFTAEDLPFLATGDNLFARKFDEEVDAKILDILEANLIIDDDFAGNLAPIHAETKLTLSKTSTSGMPT